MRRNSFDDVSLRRGPQMSFTKAFTRSVDPSDLTLFGLVFVGMIVVVHFLGQVGHDAPPPPPDLQGAQIGTEAFDPLSPNP